MCDEPSSSSSPSSPKSRAQQPLHRQMDNKPGSDLLRLVAQELESMRCIRAANTDTEEAERSFPPACLRLLQTLEGNQRCHDCSAPQPEWASVSYGVTLCLQCSGKHRGLGVNCSFIKSLALDSWKRREILCLLEGGNDQLSSFFERHEMGHVHCEDGHSTPPGSRNSSPSRVGVTDRYKTKAASFYRQHLLSHAKELADKGGLYEGRAASRSKDRRKKSKRRPRKCKPVEPQLPTVEERPSVDSSGHSSDSSFGPGPDQMQELEGDFKGET
ncbi:hypothetical protein THAOC_17074 [Thalassiosira oceanica]|uniref:Arf-GAP domain-containing protein n=1 Tax=Thalassiosira oceanica TaxID=159749 RepID=K0SMZ7_THAOC|nr:hypothetical protein THAOC_17074 [Thalassiosira oceanica]|eukprot:EJK62316.1 hypothetical protein THAOC_17074 [Thalassiosira oceanica]